MPLAPAIALLLTDHTTRYRFLTVGGVDVVLNAGTAANRLGTSIDSVHVTERGHEGVSSMTFTVEDPGLEFTVADGMEVAFQLMGATLPTDNFTFRGWVDHWDQQPTNPGRVYTISAIGPEALLDWAILLDDLVLASGRTALDAIQSCAALSVGRGPLNFNASGGTSGQGGLQRPVAGDLSGFTLLSALTITAGTTLREAIRQVLVASNAAGNPFSPGVYYTTVDFFWGLRIFLGSTVLGSYSCDVADWNSTGTVSDTSVSNSLGATQELHYDTEGATVRAVFVKGANAAGTGLVPDGSGLLGATSYITDATSDSAARLALVGNAYLASYAVKVRGAATLGPIVASLFSGVHPGEPFGPTVDTAFPANINRIEISQIDKEFIGSLETWTFAFGGFPPSGTNLMRHFTGQPRG